MINRLRVKNYKSLKDLDVSLRPLTIFVGPNNAGKSNIIDSLLLMTELLNQGAGAVHGRGGFPDIVWNSELSRSISIVVDGDLELQRKKRRFTYELGLVGGPQHFALNKENFTVFDNHEARPLMKWDSQRLGVDIFDEQSRQMVGFSGDLNQSFLRHATSSPDRFGAVGQFAKALSEWSSYDPDTLRTRTPSEARRVLRLEERAENLSSVLHTLQTEFPSHFTRLKETLKIIVPELLDLYTPLTEQGRTLVKMNEEGLSMPIPLWALSDGTIHSLGILTALHVPSPPGLMCFEEPENYVHPRVLQVLAEAFKDASFRSQILITTHSPYFLDCFTPADVVVVEKAKGSTQAKRASRRKGIRAALEALGLGEAWYAGSIGGVPEP